MADRSPRGATARLQFNWFLAAALLIGGVAALPLLQPHGLLNTRGGGDSPFLLQRVQQLVAALTAGHFPARWMPDANYGYGYPFFNFYAPLSIYVAALFRLIGFSYTGAIQLAQLAGFLLAAAGSFWLARRWLDDAWGALLASVAYSVAPFHLVNVYVRGDSLAEFWAMALYPWVLLALEQVLDAQTRAARLRAAAGLALAYGALVLSHNISALIASPFLALFGLAGVLARPQRAVRLLWLAGGAAWGLLLSAWFWLPAIAERMSVQLGPVTEGYFFYGNHFRALDLVQRRWLFDYSVTGAADPFRMGLVQTLLIVAGCLAALWQLRRRRGTQRAPLAALLLMLAVATLMITPLARPLWAGLPLLDFTQFPWRFLSLQALAGALLTGALATAVAPARRPIVALLAAGLLVVAGLGGLRVDYLLLSDDDITPRALAEYEWFSGNIGTTISAEYLPTTVQPRPYTSGWLNGRPRRAATVLSGAADAVWIPDGSGVRQQWQITVHSAEAQLMLPTLYWDGWRATSNGQPIALLPLAGSGLIGLTLPAGTHDIVLWLGRMPLRATTELLGLAALLALLLVGRHALWGQRRWLVLVALALLPLLLIDRLWPQPDSALQSWDFGEMAYLHGAANGVSYGAAGALLAAEFATEITTGEALAITLDWQGQPLTATLALVTPAVHRATPNAPAPLFAPTTWRLQSGRQTIALPLPAAMPAGLYVPRLQIAGAWPQTATGRARGDLFLAPVQVTAAPVIDVGALGQGLSATARAVEARPDGTLHVEMVWQTDAPLTHNYQATVRLFDRRNLFYAEFDGQPGYGFQPSSTWRPGQPVNDWLTLRWLADDGEAPYVLVASLYDPADGTLVFRRRLGELQAHNDGLIFEAGRPQFALPDGVTPLDARFGSEIALRGYTLERSDATLTLTLYWQADGVPTRDYTHFVHLVAVDRDDQPAAQHDMMPQFSTYPTTQWAVGEIVADPAPLALDDLAAGEYRLQVGLYYRDGEQFVRLPVSAADGLSVQADALILPDVLTLPR